MAGVPVGLDLRAAEPRAVATDNSGTAARSGDGIAPDVLLVASRLIASAQTERVFLITGIDEDGQTVALAQQLAAGLALQGGQPVVLVEGDAKLTPLSVVVRSDGNGLVELAAGTASATDVSNRPVGQPFDVVVSGASRSTLSAPAAAIALQKLREQYHYVVICAGRILSSPNSAMLAHHADGVVLAVAAGRRRRSELTAVQSEVRRLGTRMLGVVVVN